MASTNLPNKPRNENTEIIEMTFTIKCLIISKIDGLKGSSSFSGLKYKIDG